MARLASRVDRAGGVAAVAARYGRSPRTVQGWIRRGKLPADVAASLRQHEQARAALAQAGGADELAALMGRSPRTVQGWIRRGKLPDAVLPELRRMLAARQASVRQARAAERARAVEQGRAELQQREAWRFDLERLNAAHASRHELAKALGVSYRTVNQWLRQGPPLAEVGRIYRVRRQLELAAEQERQRARDRRDFEQLLRQADRAGDLPASGTRRGMRSGPRTEGYYWQWGLGYMLDEPLIDEIVAWILRHARLARFDLWNGMVMLSSFGAEVGSAKIGVKNYGNPRWQDFNVQGVEGTRETPQLTEVASELRQRLVEALERKTLVLVHYVSIRNYRLRTREERIRWEATQRRRK